MVGGGGGGSLSPKGAIPTCVHPPVIWTLDGIYCTCYILSLNGITPAKLAYNYIVLSMIPLMAFWITFVVTWTWKATPKVLNKELKIPLFKGECWRRCIWKTCLFDAFWTWVCRQSCGEYTPPPPPPPPPALGLVQCRTLFLNAFVGVLWGVGGGGEEGHVNRLMMLNQGPIA